MYCAKNFLNCKKFKKDVELQILYLLLVDLVEFFHPCFSYSVRYIHI